MKDQAVTATVLRITCPQTILGVTTFELEHDITYINFLHAKP